MFPHCWARVWEFHVSHFDINLLTCLRYEPFGVEHYIHLPQWSQGLSRVSLGWDMQPGTFGVEIGSMRFWCSTLFCTSIFVPNCLDVISFTKTTAIWWASLIGWESLLFTIGVCDYWWLRVHCYNFIRKLALILSDKRSIKCLLYALLFTFTTFSDVLEGSLFFYLQSINI